MKIKILETKGTTERNAGRKTEGATGENADKEMEGVIINTMETNTSVRKFQRMDLADAMVTLRANRQIFRRTNDVTRPCLLHIH